MNSDSITGSSFEEITAATERIEVFCKKYQKQDDDYRMLVRYAAFPLVLTPDLLYQIWAIFTKETAWIAVARILLSSLCQEIGYETYQIELSIRNQLLKELKDSELQELGQFMLQYIDKRINGSDEYTQNLKERQRLTALAYIQPSQAAKELAQKLSNRVQKPEDIREAFRWTTFIKTLANPLTEKGFEPLLTYNDIIIKAAYGKRETPEYSKLIQEWQEKETEFRQKVNLIDQLKLPFIQPKQQQEIDNIFQNINATAKNFDVEVVTLSFDEESSKQEEETAKKQPFETVFVNQRAVTIETRECEAYYYDEILDLEAQALPPQSKIQNPKSKIRMLYIPEGKFWMGSPENEKERYDDESPQHKVTVSSFFMSETAITEAQWHFVANLPQEQRKLDPNPSNNGDDHPVVNLRWQDAIEFCARLSRHTGRNYRLPSEAEWEYACRSVIINSEELTKSEWNEKYNKPFHFGETITSKLANYNSSVVYQQEPKGEYRNKTTSVYTFKPNAFGLYDMHGNVWEWCLDPWHSNYEGAPNDGRAWDEGKEELYENILTNLNTLLQDDRSHVLRGGSWHDLPRNCRSAYRNYFDLLYYFSGFRVVCVPPRNPSPFAL